MSSGVMVTSLLDSKVYPLEAVSAADHLIKLKRKHIDGIDGTRKNFWLVVDEIVKLWKKRHPTQYRSTIYQIQDTKARLKDVKYATSKNRNIFLRRKLDIPFFVERVIRMLYSTEELPMDKDFFNEVWKRYPMFRVSESS